MATGTIIGTNFSCRGGVVEFFGVKGRQDDSVLKTIKKGLSDYTSEQLDRLAQIHVDPSSAGALYCSGVITISDLQWARERNGERISIPGVEIKGYCVELVVTKNLDDAIRYMNAAGLDIRFL